MGRIIQDHKSIKTRIMTTLLRGDGILQVDVMPEGEMKLSDAIESIQVQANLAEGTRRPLLVNMGMIKSIDRDARAYLGGEEANKNVCATALVISSPIGKVIGNFMMGLNKTLYPTRLFTNEQDALHWLRGYLK